MQIEVQTMKVVNPYGKETLYIVIGEKMETKVVINVAASTYDKACKLLGVNDEAKKEEEPKNNEARVKVPKVQ